ncbi:hypothetical protein HA050_08925 [Iodobacter sp. HSC-16F04]|uniref:DUF2846 domain-containing protein n=1 Tax=Iodobacter violaceini TaxID=3044271 RepID=A0ABX0L159_9NEIS|nr:hypothetical protein [Iodobacter violacea]NHQ86238.1 hypothetical protein [Iodobacter violacea]
MKMQNTKLVNTVKPDFALVTFVRPAVFFGDGLDIDVWDGEHFVGSLGAGKLIQHEVEPGEHLFLANSENWSYVSGNLIAGKHYFIKANLFPGVLYGRVALGVAQNTDPRIQEWQKKLKPTHASDKDKLDMEAKKRKEIDAALQEFKTGNISTFAKLQAENAL